MVLIKDDSIDISGYNSATFMNYYDNVLEIIKVREIDTKQLKNLKKLKEKYSGDHK